MKAFKTYVYALPALWLTVPLWGVQSVSPGGAHDPASLLERHCTIRASVSSEGLQSDLDEPIWGETDISANGRFVVFSSLSNTLVADDNNGVRDIFLRDLTLGVTVRVSVSSIGAEGNGLSRFPSISPDGRFVTFSSTATNLVEDDTNGFADVFLHDLVTGETSLISVDGAGIQGNAPSSESSVSLNGLHIAFVSLASNLVASDSNSHLDVFVRDLTSQETVRVSEPADGGDANAHPRGVPSISDDGRIVTFMSYASNLVESDLNGAPDVFYHDRDVDTDGDFDEPLARETLRVSLGVGSTEAIGPSLFPSVSADGGTIVFWSMAGNLVADDLNGTADVFAYDVEQGTISLVSVGSSGELGNAPSCWCGISGNGRYLAFQSFANNFVPIDTNGTFDIFRKDLLTGKVSLVSTSSAGIQGDRISGPPVISDDGRVIIFRSEATNLVPGDTNELGDVFANGPCSVVGQN